MSIKDQIHSTPEYQAIASASAAEQRASADPDTVGAAMTPLLSLEKGDVEFWMQVAQTVLLLLILREMMRGAA